MPRSDRKRCCGEVAVCNLQVTVRRLNVAISKLWQSSLVHHLYRSLLLDALKFRMHSLAFGPCSDTVAHGGALIPCL
jgi:hypothetical protein